MKETEKMKDLWSWHRNKKCSGDWRRMLFVWPSLDISRFLCVQPFPDPSSTSSLLSLHYLVTFCFYCRSTFSLSITPSPYLPTHFFHIMLFLFLSLSSFFHAFTPSVFLYFTTLSFFCYSCAVSLPLSLKKSPPRISTCECLYLELSSPHFYVCSPWDAHTDTVYSLVHINWTCCESVSQQETDTEEGSLLFTSQLLQPL